MELQEKILSIYNQFPNRTDFIVEIEEQKPVFYFCNSDGLKKSHLLAFYLGLKDCQFIPTDKKFILDKLEQLQDQDIQGFEKNIDNEEDQDTSDILASSYEDPPIIKLVNQIIINAVRNNASDIHFEGQNNNFIVRFRIDGQLTTYKRFPKNIQEAVLARLKIISDLNIAETRKPQDGRIHLKIGNRDIDIRVSIIPSVNGEKAVLRILEKTRQMFNLDNIGMPPEMLTIYRHYLFKPNGIILVTGPTGSGKTTTLYASLLEMDRENKNVLTIEDPVEYHIDNVTQVQVNPSINITFANAIRSFLRQDPDIIMVGEIRDQETAKAAVEAALTGHLVISTLHTNDAPTAAARLIDMEVEPFLISSSLLVVVGQRLVRKICPKCKTRIKAQDHIRNFFENAGLELDEYEKGQGCKDCFYTGYKGRIGVFEIMPINDPIRRLINKKASAFDIKKEATKYGYKTMFEHGYELIKQGITTAEEVIATTKSD